jgi:hypothetical protein
MVTGIKLQSSELQVPERRLTWIARMPFIEYPPTRRVRLDSLSVLHCWQSTTLDRMYGDRES